MRRGWEKGKDEENFTEWDYQDGGRTEMRARKELFWFGGAVIGLEGTGS